MMKQLVWKLPNYLETHGLTRYQLMQELGDGKGRVAYKWKDLPDRLDTEVLERVMGALEKLTGGPVKITDLLEYGPGDTDAVGSLTAAGVPYTGDPETDWWLDNQPDILERVKRFEAGGTKLIPLKDIAAKYGVER